MKFKALAAAALIAAAIPILALAQPGHRLTISGDVSDDEGLPLAGAHVFVAGSMIGTTTDTDGGYELQGVPTGALRLYVSMVGFEPAARDLLLRVDGQRRFDFKLKAAVIEVGEVIVEAKRDKHWRKRLATFTKLFLGETPNAETTRIVNPEVLDFTDNRGLFKAVASEPLVIENRALGYRVRYFLKDFEAEMTRTRYDGEPLYEALDAVSDGEEIRWAESRKAAFVGSFRHFLLALLAERTEEQGFQVYGRTAMPAATSGLGGQAGPGGGSRFPLDPTSLIRHSENPGEAILDFKGFVEIVFTGELEDEAYLSWRGAMRRSQGYQTSWIELGDGPTIVDYKGDVLDPYGVTFYGYLAFERVADEVPREYRPGTGS